MENTIKVVVRGEAVVHSASRNVKAPMRGASLKKFHGVNDDAVFSEYFHKAMPKEMLAGEQQQSLIDAGVEGGYMEFVFDDKENKLFVETTYDALRRLDPHEETVLIEYTQGQWSDGIGEGFEQHEERGGYISAWHRGQEAEIIYR